MAEIIKMPKLSDTMEEGVVAKWLKQVGEQLEEGEVLAEIETDKATMEYESFQEGTILYLGVEEGKAAPVDSVLAIVGEKGEDYQSLLNGSAASAAPVEEKVEAAPAAAPAPAVDTSSINAIIVKMPKLSDTMEEGTVAAWHKHVGDTVASGEVLAEIETDKATMEFESFDDGELLYIGVEEGNSAPVDDVLAVIGEKGADYQSLIQAYQAKDTAAAPAPVAEEAPVEEKSAPVVTQTSSNGSAVVQANTDGRVKISPLARKLAKDGNIDINTVVGSGEGGRIVKRDIENYVAPAAPAAQAAATVAPMAPIAVGEERSESVPVSQMRKTIAKRLSESKFSAPHFYLTIEVDMDQAMASRKAINALPDTKISFNDLVIKAAAMALRKHPYVNAGWMGDHIQMNHHIHIGVAVAVDEGLLVPVVRFADNKSLTQIGAEVKDYATRAREKKLQPKDWEGGTFSISNLGMFGIEEFTAIINPPNACILAVGAIRQVPVVRDGELTVGNVMKVTLSCDHRVVDGATGSEFLGSFKQYLENPVTMLS